MKDGGERRDVLLWVVGKGLEKELGHAFIAIKYTRSWGWTALLHGADGHGKENRASICCASIMSQPFIHWLTESPHLVWAFAISYWSILFYKWKTGTEKEVLQAPLYLRSPERWMRNSSNRVLWICQRIHRSEFWILSYVWINEMCLINMTDATSMQGSCYKSLSWGTPLCPISQTE